MGDVKENAMANGEPVKVRTLDASGNSITTEPNKLAKVMRAIQCDMLYGNSANATVFSKVAVMNAPNTEGAYCSMSLLISGGNLYTGPANIVILSICVHQGVVKVAKNNLIGNQELGYVYSGNILTIWIKRAQYTHYTNVSVLSERGNEVLTSNESVSSIPNGYVII